MRVALVFKAGVADTLREKLIGIKDNLDMDCFDSVSKMANMSIKRNIIYDRVVFVANLVSQSELSTLHQWWGSVSDRTELVMLSRKDVDSDITELFCDNFVSPLVAVMLLDKPTVKLVADAVVLKTSEINSKYGVGDLIQVEVERDFEYTPEPVEQPKVEEPRAVEQKKPEQKKQGFMSKLFGGKGKQESTPTPSSQPVQPVDEYNDVQTEYVEQETYQEPFVDDIPQPEQNWGMPSPDMQMPLPNTGTFVASDDEDVTVQVTPFEDNLDAPISEVALTESENDTFTPFEDENFSSTPELTTTMVETVEEEPMQEMIMEEEDFNQSMVEEPMYTEPQPSVQVQPMYQEPVAPVNQQVIPTTPVSHQPIQATPNFVVEEVDEDFSVGFEGYTEAQQNQGVGVVEVDMSMTGVDLASAEEAYRQKANEKNTVVKVVEKEVIKEVNKGYNLLGSVLKGRQRKIIVVTGDRATGVTSTALTLAEMFSKHVKVLYFDCDIKNHGLLSYIDYDVFRDYEDIHMQGTKLCKNSRAFKNCVCSLAHNLDFLTTDYSCDVTPEELENAQGIVSEYSGDYGVVIVDCPVENLQYIPDLVMTGVGIICVEGSKRGIMNMLCQFELSKLSLRYKRNLASKGTMMMTKCTKQVDVPKLLKEMREMFDPDGVDWFDMRIRAYNGGKISDKLLNEILEQ